MSRNDPVPMSTLDFAGLSRLRAQAQRQNPDAARGVAQQFEGLMTQMMVKSMREASKGDDLTGRQGATFRDLYDQQIAQQISSGKGLGLTDTLMRQLALNTPATASASGAASTGATTASTAASGAASGSVAASSSTEAAAIDEDMAAVCATREFCPGSAREFVAAVRPAAEQAAKELGVPARALIAQAALETGWGKHMPKHADGSSSFNLFGIKAHGGWNGDRVQQSTREFRDGRMTTERAAFRSYESVDEAFQDYVGFLKANPRYADALRAGGTGNVHAFARGLQKAGYATDPGYAQKLVSVAYGATMNSVMSPARGAAPTLSV
jgi:flagellar protein FlgJ